MKLPSKEVTNEFERMGHRLTRKRAPTCCGRKMRDAGRSMVMFLRKSKARDARTYKGLSKALGRKIKPPANPASPTVNYRCSKCGKNFERNMEDDERRRFCQHDQATSARSAAMHKTFHAFRKKFGGPGLWKWSGWDFMSRLEKYKKSPDITIHRCDDSVHASSNIVAIAHELPDYYWGTTFVVIPQCTGEPPTEFFFYGNHAKGFMDFLRDVVKKHRQMGEY